MQLPDYVIFPRNLGKFDIVIIDGANGVGRYDCAKEVASLLDCSAKQGVMVILDNSDWFKNTAKYLRNLGLIEVDFHGFGAINGYTWTTSIFLSRDFNFEPINGEQPHYSKAALYHYEDKEK